jgi:glycosyltransferase involved in cell wall biosynthesis
MPRDKRSKTPTATIAFVVNDAAFFVSHRLPIAMAALAHGYRVVLVTGSSGRGPTESAAEVVLANHGIPHERVSFTNFGTNPFVELRGVIQLYGVLKRLRPDLVHCVTPKGILYGACVARVWRVRAIVIAVSGMGYAFSNTRKGGVRRSAIATIYLWLARFSYGHRNKRVIVQNKDDLTLLLDQGLARKDEILLIQGSGVDLSRIPIPDYEVKERVVLFPARMIYEKGVIELIEAARILKRSFPDWKFVLAGSADSRNPSSVPPERLAAFQEEGIIEWVGHMSDIAGLFQKASIVCLPSYYGEGLPKSLLEAAAYGCAVVTADSTGCREAILPGVSGLLVPPRTIEPLAQALHGLMADTALRRTFGRAGRELAERSFAVGSVACKTIAAYDDLLGRTS